MVCDYLKQKCLLYQQSPNLKKHILFNLILIALTIFIRTMFEFYLREQMKSQIESNLVESDIQSEEVNQQQINDNTQKKNIQNLQLYYMILDQLLHLFLSLEIITLVFQITLLMNKQKEELLPILDPLLDQQKNNTCSLQFVKSSNYGISSLQNNEATYYSIEMQVLSKNKGKTNQIQSTQGFQSPYHAIQNQFNNNTYLSKQEIPQIQEETNTQTVIQEPSEIQVTVNPSKQTLTQNPSEKLLDKLEQNKTTNEPSQIIYSKLLGRGQRYIDGKYENVYIIQKCEKQKNCNFFWISQTKSTNYFCLNCDQKNILIQNEQPKEKKIKQNINIETNKIVLSNKFEQELYEITQNYKVNRFKFCQSYEFCGFFWIDDQSDNQSEYYCPICQELYYTKIDESFFNDINLKCSLCKQDAFEYFQSSCYHVYHYECLKELGKNQNQLTICCVDCNVNITSCLKKNQLISNEKLENILSNQIKWIREQTMHEGIEDLE